MPLFSILLALLVLAIIFLWLKLRDARHELAKERVRDPLTALLNRQEFLELAQREVNRSQRAQRPISMLLMDIDRLRDINRQFGQSGGDLALQYVASQIRLSIRDFDLAGRYAGEELALLLPDTSLGGAAIVAERIRKRVAESGCMVGTHPAPVSVSIAACEITEETMTLEDLLLAAEATLEHAHKKGDNLVMLYGEQADT
ncbi:GGDEF domain-containing protein [Chitinilyticum piscinae]|uniref:diguanylate cyclase n=1 Tax=Chitinilyticum piscinae TaxID=2866724 RepID=A0A8J7FHT8_9NEIS|nr:GGDEF domain-containing protein [Chitinilyticum piscinae]MBE9608460.1 GGDEF domain-containing protein [Chitinilyticum piscinae]